MEQNKSEMYLHACRVVRKKEVHQKKKKKSTLTVNQGEGKHIIKVEIHQCKTGGT